MQKPLTEDLLMTVKEFRRAREPECRALWLQVNKRNTDAVGFYRSAGFEVVREAVFEIGGGFVMDDYVMARRV